MKPFCIWRAAAALLLLSLSGCHLNRPGEYRPQTSAACAPQQVDELETRFEQLSESERDRLEYCRLAQASEAQRATQEHLDYIADVQFISILLGATAIVLNIVADATG
jgi:hypothetical protein